MDDDVPGMEKRMSLGDHISELRQRLIICLVAVGVILLGAMFFWVRLWHLALMPLQWTAAITGMPMAKLVTFRWDGPLDGFIAVLRIDLLFTLVLTLPLIIYEIWAFVAPGLTVRERKGIVTIFVAGSGLFLLGAAIAFRFAAPMGMRFLIWFNSTLENSSNLWTGKQYIAFLTMVCLGFGMAFETPLVMMALARVGLITPDGIVRYWRHAMLAMVVLGAVLTPPDPFTQILLASILAVLFFAGYLLARWVTPVYGKHGDEIP